MYDIVLLVIAIEHVQIVQTIVAASPQPNKEGTLR